MSAPKQLTAEELKYIDAFCKKKDIVYVDLRIELVDHLAELVLAYQEKHPNCSFRDAFHGVYKSFGIFGFMDIATQHENQMQKRYWLEMWHYFKSWLSPPKIFLTLCLSIGIYLIVDSFSFLRQPTLMLTGMLFLCSIGVTVFQFRRNKKILDGEKNLLMTGSHNGIVLYSYVFGQVLIRLIPREDGNFTHPWFISGLFVFTLIFGLANYFLQEKAKTQLLVMKAQML